MPSRRPKFLQRVKEIVSPRPPSLSPPASKPDKQDGHPFAVGPPPTAQDPEIRVIASVSGSLTPISISSISTEVQTTQSLCLSPFPSSHGTAETRRDDSLPGSNEGILAETETAKNSEDKSCSAPSAKAAEDLWEQAYRRLSNENPDLVAQYENILFLEEAEEKREDPNAKNSVSSPGIGLARTRLAELSSKKLAALDESRLKIRVGSKTVALKDGVDQVLTVVVAVKDFISELVSSEPHAALAWTGVCLLLPLLLNPKQQYEDATAGLLEIPLIIRRYQVLENVYRKYDEDSGQLKAAFEEKLTKLYSCILQYQARAVCQWSRGALHQYSRDVFQADGWVKLLQEIRNLDSSCKEIVQTMDAGLWQRISETQHLQLQKSLQDWCVQHQNALEELRHSLKKSLDFAETQRQEKLRYEEKLEERGCHQAFGPSNYLEHKNQNPSRVPGTCNWFLKHEIFIGWQAEEYSSLLWVSADPGCGKSVLAKSIIDEDLLFASAEVPSVCYFFFKTGFTEQQGAARCMSALLHQLFANRLHLIKHAMPHFRRDGQSISKSWTVTWDILINAASDPEAAEIICVIDALDECEEESRFKIIDALKSIYSDQKRCQTMKLKFLVTSRPYEDIQRRLRALTNNFPTIHLKGEQESEAIGTEINLVITKRVPEIAIELELSKEVEASLLTSLLNVPSRTYLWLYLILDEIKKSIGATTVKRLRNLIGNLPKTVEEVYTEILVGVTDPARCRRLFHIILAATRPLTLMEVNIALNISDGTETLSDLDLEDETHFEKSVRSLCGLFLSVVDRKLYLIHETAREFLVCPEFATPDTSVWKQSFIMAESNLILAKCCILYLLCSDIDIQYSTKDRTTSTLTAYIKQLEMHHHFLNYSTTFWLQHYDEDLSDPQSLSQVSALLDSHPGHARIWMVYFGEEHTDWLFQRCYYQWPSVFFAVYFGFTHIASKMLQNQTDINKPDAFGRTALMIAAHVGNRKMVRVLLGAGAKIDAADKDQEQALHFACMESHEDVIHLLLEMGADVNAKSRNGTALHAAAEYGRVDVMRFLLSCKNIEVNAEGGNWGTALQTAVYADLLDLDAMNCVEVLLDHGADINLNGRSCHAIMQGPPIAISARHGERKVIQQLLDRGAEINATGGAFRSAIHAATEYGHLTTLRMLLDRGADLMQVIHDSRNPESEGMTVFDEASLRDKRDIIQLLLNYRPELHPSSSRLALQAAVKYGNAKMVEFALENSCPGEHALKEISQLSEDSITWANAKRKELWGRIIDDFAEKQDLIQKRLKIGKTCPVELPHFDYSDDASSDN